MVDFDEMRKWNNRCPKCRASIHFRLYSGTLGATAPAKCGRNVSCSRILSRAEVRAGTVEVCDWRGYAVRMWDGSVRFKNEDGRFLFEWR